MNLLQIIRKARLNVDAIRTNNVTSALWGDDEVVDAVNTAMDTAARIIRLADSRILSKTLVSTDGAAYGSGNYGAGSYGSMDLISETYNLPSIIPNTTDYILPPDFVRVVSIRPTDSGFQSLTFRPAAAQDKYFLDQRSIPSSDLSSGIDSNQVFWYTLVGPRGIRFTPTPMDTIDLELVYDYRPPKLLYSVEGTVSITSGDSGVTGTGSTWFSSGIRNPAEVVIGADAVNTVQLGRNYPHIDVVVSDTVAALTRVWQQASVVASPYGLAMVPLLPEEHHAWLAELAAATLMKKVNIEVAMKMEQALEKVYKDTVQPEITIRQIQESLPVDPYSL